MSRGRGKETSTCRRVSLAAGGEVVGGREPVDTAESPERGEPRENSHGWKYKSFFVFLLLLSLSLFRFFFTPRSFIRGCNLDLGFIARDRTCCFLFLLFLFLFLASFFLSFFVSFL